MNCSEREWVRFDHRLELLRFGQEFLGIPVTPPPEVYEVQRLAFQKACFDPGEPPDSRS
jgi:hypothetical protein